MPPTPRQPSKQHLDRSSPLYFSPTHRHPNPHPPLLTPSTLARYPDMDRVISAELLNIERELIGSLVLGDTAALVDHWGALAQKLREAVAEGWLSDATLALARCTAAKVTAVAGGVIGTEEKLSQIRQSTRVEFREYLARAGASAFVSTGPPPSKRRASISTSTPSTTTPSVTPKRKSKPSLQSHRTPSSAAVALDELHASRPLREWFTTHLANPWPSAEQKAALLARVPSQTQKQLSNWFTNARRRSGWNVIFEEHAGKDRDRMASLVRDLEQPEWAGVEVDPKAREDVEKVRAYFGEKQNLHDDVLEVLQARQATTTTTTTTATTTTTTTTAPSVVDASGLFDVRTEPFFLPSPPQEVFPYAASSSSSASPPSATYYPSPPSSRIPSYGSTDSRHVSSSSTPQNPSSSSLPPAYDDPRAYYDLPIPSYTELGTTSSTHLYSSIPTSISLPEHDALLLLPPPPPSSSFGLPLPAAPSPYFLTIAEHPYALAGPMMGYWMGEGYGDFGDIEVGRRASE